MDRLSLRSLTLRWHQCLPFFLYGWLLPCRSGNTPGGGWCPTSEFFVSPRSQKHDRGYCYNQLIHHHSGVLYLYLHRLQTPPTTVLTLRGLEIFSPTSLKNRKYQKSVNKEKIQRIEKCSNFCNFDWCCLGLGLPANWAHCPHSLLHKNSMCLKKVLRKIASMKTYSNSY